MQVMFSVKSVAANVARLIYLAALTIATIQRDRKTIVACAAGDLQRIKSAPGRIRQSPKQVAACRYRFAEMV